METPEEFVARDDVRRDLDGEYRTVDADAIRARDNAVRLALLDEFQGMVEEATVEGTPLLVALGECAIELRLKYTPPMGKL